MTVPSLAIAVLTTGERVPLTDSWDAAQKLWRDGRYDPDDVVRIELDTAASGEAVTPQPQTFVQEILL